MARIWFSVCGDGMGHAVRSRTIIRELSKKHEVIVTCADKAYPYLKRYFPAAISITGNRFVYQDNELKMTKSVVRFLATLPYYIIKNTAIIWPMLKRFRPQVIISDFESSAHYFSWFFGIPCIDIDNIHTQTDCHIGIDKPFYITPMIRFLHPAATKQVIPFFSGLKPKRPKKTSIATPVIRDEIRQLKSSKKGFGLVYQTTTTNLKMLPALEESGRDFRVYGIGKNGSEGMIKFMNFGDEGFLKDLAACDFVIVNGGFNVITEAIFLKKPILCIPIKGQFEQEYNAHMVEKLGYGMNVEHLDKRNLDRFLRNAPMFESNLERMPRWSNDDFFGKLDLAIKGCLGSLVLFPAVVLLL